MKQFDTKLSELFAQTYEYLPYQKKSDLLVRRTDPCFIGTIKIKEFFKRGIQSLDEDSVQKVLTDFMQVKNVASTDIEIFTNSLKNIGFQGKSFFKQMDIFKAAFLEIEDKKDIDYLNNLKEDVVNKINLLLENLNKNYKCSQEIFADKLDCKDLEFFLDSLNNLDFNDIVKNRLFLKDLAGSILFTKEAKQFLNSGLTTNPREVDLVEQKREALDNYIENLYEKFKLNGFVQVTASVLFIAIVTIVWKKLHCHNLIEINHIESFENNSSSTDK